GTGAEIGARLMRLDPHVSRPIGDQVGLAGNPRDPKTMGDIGRLEREECRAPSEGITDGYMKFVRGYHAQLGVPDLPPPLLPDHRDLDRVRRLGRRLDFMNHSGRGEHEHEDDDERHRGPRRLYLSAPVDLRRLRTLRSSRSAKSHQAVDNESRDHYE